HARGPAGRRAGAVGAVGGGDHEPGHRQRSGGMIKLLGNLVFLALLYGAMLAADPGARTTENHRILAQRVGLAGVVGLAVGAVIVTGGIDLSIGSVVALIETVLSIFLIEIG